MRYNYPKWFKCKEKFSSDLSRTRKTLLKQGKKRREKERNTEKPLSRLMMERQCRSFILRNTLQTAARPGIVTHPKINPFIPVKLFCGWGMWYNCYIIQFIASNINLI